MVWLWAALPGTAHPSGAGGVVGEVLGRAKLNSASHPGQKGIRRSGKSGGPRRQELTSGG